VETFPALTGLVHISGVDDPTLAIGDMRDANRVLVGPADRVDNIAQIRALRAAGYAGPISFEPFAAELRTLRDPAAAIRASMDFARTELIKLAA
jgi:2-keto-myo-inositol isomerase